MKLFLYPEHVLVLWAAKTLGRPVKWVPDRADSFVTDTQGRDNITRLELALDEDLHFLGLSVDADRQHGRLSVEFRAGDPDLLGRGDA